MRHQRHPERRNEVRAGIRFWDGDETDASIVIDEEGFLYVGRHASFNVRSWPQKRGYQVGSLMKLDPTDPDDPVVWDVQIGGFEPDGGILERRRCTTGWCSSPGRTAGSWRWTRRPERSPAEGSPRTHVGLACPHRRPDPGGGLRRRAPQLRHLESAQEAQGAVKVSCRGASSRPRRMGRDDLGGARGGAIYGIGDALVPSNRTIAEWFGPLSLR